MGMTKQQNKALKIMKEIKVIGLNKPIEVPEHILIDDTKKCVLISIKVKQIVSAENADKFDGSKRLSIIAEKPFRNSDGEEKTSLTKNGQSLANSIVGYDDLNFTMSECLDINDNAIFTFNKVKKEQATLFNAMLNGAIMTIASIPIKSGSPSWADEGQAYDTDVIHYEVLSISIPNEAKAVARLEKAYEKYIKKEEEKARLAAAAEAAQALPEL